MDKKCRLAFNISLLSLFGLFVCICIIIFHSSKIGVVTIDTYLGVAATFIGICATLIVGLQIWNHIEFENKLSKIDGFIDNYEKMQDRSESTSRMLSSVLANLSDDIADKRLKIVFMIMAIYNNIPMTLDDATTSKSECTFKKRLKKLEQYLKDCDDNSLQDMSYYLKKFQDLALPLEYKSRNEYVTYLCKIQKLMLSKMLLE